jgi:hypothetical protein
MPTTACSTCLRFLAPDRGSPAVSRFFRGKFSLQQLFYPLVDEKVKWGRWCSKNPLSGRLWKCRLEGRGTSAPYALLGTGAVPEPSFGTVRALFSNTLSGGGACANTSFTPTPAPHPLPALEKSRRTPCRSSPTTRTAGGTPTDACLSKPSSPLCALWCVVPCGGGAHWRGSRPSVPRCAGATRL